MSKPLELVVYRQARNFKGELDPNVFAVNGFWTYRPYDVSKRLTDAELAAEHHSAVLDVYRSKVHGVPTLEALDRMAVVLRFCLNDHHDSEDAL